MLVTTLLAFLALPPSPAQDADRDSDRDGLTDVHETHKYGTDPKKKDSDGDGIPDGDWNERREYAYTVRSVVQVMRPVTIEYLNDDYQDARVLDETEDWVELEVVHYPLSTISEAEGSKKQPRGLKEWLRPGPSSDASPALGKAIRAAMVADGEDDPNVSTKEGVVAAAKWLLNHAEYHKGFTSFVTAFDDDGRPYVPDALKDNASRNSAEHGRSVEEQWQREVLASGMFENGCRGSCTSSAIYLTGCLRALGVPTRTVLCIPIIDASDEREWDLLRLGVSHHGVRQTIHRALDGARNAWASHTYNEVWVEGRWRRLNYTRLDQPILDEQYFGLMTHVATFHDWADARFWSTVGMRQKTDRGPDVFGFRNPYSTIALRDEFGVHCDVDNPETPVIGLDVTALHWSDSDALPGDIVEGCARKGRFGLIAEVLVDSSGQWERFIEGADTKMWLKQDSMTIGCELQAGCWWSKGDRVFVYVPLGDEAMAAIRGKGAFRASARNEKEGFRWELDLTVRRES